MKIILIMVMSVDGKTTKWFDPHIYSWTSPEDQQHFLSLIAQAKAIIMGRKTYEVIKHQMKHIPGRLRLVMSSAPERFQNEVIAGQLEFTNETPEELVNRLEAKGFEEILLVGGEGTNTRFLQSDLVDEIWLTIEPKIFGSGNGLVDETKLDLNLQLISSQQLNENGTLLLKYRVVKKRTI